MTVWRSLLPVVIPYKRRTFCNDARGRVLPSLRGPQRWPAGRGLRTATLRKLATMTLLPESCGRRLRSVHVGQRQFVREWHRRIAMSSTSRIEWTDATWNPVTGCTRMSPGCDHCYAERDGEAAACDGESSIFTNGFRAQDAALGQGGRAAEVAAAASDIRQQHERSVPRCGSSDFRAREVFDTMAAAHWHEFQILTKRARRLPKIAGNLVWPPNVWLGVSVESREYAWRADYLRGVPAAVRFLSVEPLGQGTGRPELELDEIDWVIVGGESGPGARPMDVQWARAVRDQCVAASVPFFFKQWGGVRKHRTGRTLDGRTWDEFPDRRRKNLTPITRSALTSPVQAASLRRPATHRRYPWTSGAHLNPKLTRGLPQESFVAVPVGAAGVLASSDSPATIGRSFGLRP